jgi:hypothetical protein
LKCGCAAARSVSVAQRHFWMKAWGVIGVVAAVYF